MAKRYTLLATIFCVCLVASNMFETKIFSAGSLILTGGLLLFPVSYIINDCLSEIYGYKETRFVIWSAVLLNLFIVLTAQLVRILPAAEFWDGQTHFDYIFKADFRITIASMAAFLVGSLINAKVMVKMRVSQGAKGFCWRAVISSLFGETADSLVFFPIAFWNVGLKNMLIMMITQIILKTMYEVVLLPVSSFAVKRMKSTL